MGYFEAIKAGLIACKWLILSILVISSYVYAYQKGVSSERNKWEITTMKQTVQVQKALQDATTKTMQETAKSNAYATFINEEYNAKVNEIHNARDQLVFNSVRERAACTHRASAVSVRRHPVLPIEAADDSEVGFSEEFKQFLESERRRDQINVAWIEAAVKGINELCHQPYVICQEPYKK